MHVRRLAVVLILVSASCAADDVRAEPDPPTSSSTTTAAPLAPSTTTTSRVSTVEPADSRVSCPRPANPFLEADVDGDGALERFTMEARDGGQLLVLCGDEPHGWSAEVGYGVWYLGLDDAEDGSSRLVLGAPRVGDVVESAPIYREVTVGDGVLEIARDRELDLVVAEAVRVPPVAEICADVEGGHYDVDLDGDGLDDIYAQRFNGAPGTETGPALVVCTAAGVVDELLVGGMGEVFGLSNPTGESWILWGGGTSASHAFMLPFAFVDGGIHPIMEGDRELGFQSGIGSSSANLFGCGDLDGDGVLELVQLDGVRNGEVVDWVRKSWAVSGAEATLVSSESGQVTVPVDIEYMVVDPEPNAFRDLMPDIDCGRADDRYRPAG